MPMSVEQILAEVHHLIDSQAQSNVHRLERQLIETRAYYEQGGSSLRIVAEAALQVLEARERLRMVQASKPTG